MDRIAGLDDARPTPATHMRTVFKGSHVSQLMRDDARLATSAHLQTVGGSNTDRNMGNRVCLFHF